MWNRPTVAVSCILFHGMGLIALVPAQAQDTIFFPPANRIAIRHMRSVPPLGLDKPLRVHTVVGLTGSASFAEFDSGGVTGPLHHHTREQVDVGLTGTVEASVGSHVEQLSGGYAVVIPADVSHSFANPHSGLVTAIEFHTVRRPDLLPGYPALTFPSSSKAVAVADNRALGKRINTSSGETLKGRTCVVRWRWVGSTVDLHPRPTRTELFVYVAKGGTKLTAAGRTHLVSEGSLIIIPAELAHARIESADRSKAAVIEFQVQR